MNELKSLSKKVGFVFYFLKLCSRFCNLFLYYLLNNAAIRGHIFTQQWFKSKPRSLADDIPLNMQADTIKGSNYMCLPQDGTEYHQRPVTTLPDYSMASWSPWSWSQIEEK